MSIEYNISISILNNDILEVLDMFDYNDWFANSVISLYICSSQFLCVLINDIELQSEV